jgi:hypothetical protein
MLRKSVTAFASGLGVLVLAATPAFGHECYNASRSATGNANAEKGVALSSYDELLTELCPEGAAIVQAWVSENNFATDGILVQVNALMGGGAHHNGNKPTDGHDIDYLPAGFSEAVGTAFFTCFAPPT